MVISRRRSRSGRGDELEDLQEAIAYERATVMDWLPRIGLMAAWIFREQVYGKTYPTIDDPRRDVDTEDYLTRVQWEETICESY